MAQASLSTGSRSHLLNDLGKAIEAGLDIDIRTCEKCGGDVKIIASIDGILPHKWVG